MAPASQLAEISRKIFQRMPQNGTRSGNVVASWFQKPMLLRMGGKDPNFQILNEDKIAKREQMKRRGKSTPKKGEGKRAKK
ncbi:unnamed protein product [Albugo candida]|uniref:Uncharacterized protein n=1 Tax=Albugo candida TaxID=65357 RepID=A0A024G1P0_9STRA|nr:unnamed protein product [Albugo candida]|eukprot:CCI40763.1 unnamed protein product [Albugo candida]